MLLLGSETEVAGITLFRDHLPTRTYHYLPGPPRVVVEDGKPHLSLIRYRGADTGGFLTLDVDLSIDPAVLEQVRTELAARDGGEVNLVPVLFREGTVRLCVLGTRQPVPQPSDSPNPEPQPSSLLVEDVIGSTTPSLLGAARAIFSVRLEAEAATLLEDALRSGSAPVLIVYDLSFTGLRPARGLRARVEAAMAYDYLRSRFAANTLVFKADVDAESEALRREGHITIEDVDYTGTDPAILAQREEEVRATLQELATTLFFRPAASPASLPPETMQRSSLVDEAWGRRGRPQAAFLLRDLEQGEQQSLTYDLDEAAPATARVAPQGSLRAPPGVDVSALLLDATTEGPPEVVEVRAFSPSGADWTGVEAIEVDIKAGDEVRSVVLSPQVAEGTVVLPAGDLVYRLRILADPEPDALGVPPQVDESFRPLPTLNLPLDPSAVSGRRVLSVSLGVVDPTAVRQVGGRLVVGDGAREFLLDPEHPAVDIIIWGPSAARLEGEFVTPERTSVPFERPVDPQEPVVVLNQPAAMFHLVSVMLQDPLARLASVSVELEASAGGRRGSLMLTEASPSGQWSMPRIAGGPGTFRYRVLAFGREATVVETDWREAAGSLLVVGDVDIRVDPIQVVLTGATDALGAMITLTSLDPPEGVAATVETVLDAGQAMFEARLPFRRDAPRRYRVEGEVFLADRTVPIGPLEDVSEVLVLRPGP